MRAITAAFQGRLGADAELRFTREGKGFCTFSVAVDGEAEAEGATWVRVTAWEPGDELAAQLRKGVEVYVEGRLRLDRWTAKDGSERAGLAVTARLVQPLGQIGRRARVPSAGRRADRQLAEEDNDAAPF